ncbi:uncharacterized protein PV07_08240 [Cladophialophora immunda]|uniref:Uncharacterized protein n=1 Tax=Cladophialophora immunda TaxID=569365 RepID=A0A0D2ATR8_9EURO|nr:uncharacterized protein PV07_08240 [Cladophialophora immunda]KIW28587.1 hypothetical protein PV07_08240 [Cladophialophora immunda]
MAKLLCESGASFDQPNRNDVTARDAALRIGGQMLEDLKRDIPAPWEGYRESVSEGEMDGPVLQAGESSEPHDDVNRDNVESQSASFLRNCDDSSETMGTSYAPLEGVQCPAIVSNQMDMLPSMVADDQDVPMGGINGTGDEVNVPDVNVDLPSNYFHDLGDDLFMNPWQDA